MSETTVGGVLASGDGASRRVVPLWLDPLLKHSVVLTAATSMLNASNWLYHMVMSRSLGPERYGSLSALLSLLIVVAIPLQTIQMGLSAMIARRRSDEDEAAVMRGVGRSLSTFAVFGFAGWGLLAILSPWLAERLQLNSPVPLLIAGGIICFWSTLPVLRAMLQGRRRYWSLGVSVAAEGILKLGAGLWLVAWGLGLNGAVAGIGLGALGTAALTFAVAQPWRHREAERNPRRSQANIWRPLVPYAVAIGCFTVLTQSDVIMVKAVFPAAEAGLYAAASTGGKIILYAMAAVPMVVLPESARLHSERVDTFSVLRRGSLFGGIVGGSAVVLYVLAPAQIMQLLFGPAYTGAAPLLGVLGLGMLAYAFALIGIYYRLGTRDARFLVFLILATAAFPLLVAGLRPSSTQVASLVAGMGLLVFVIVWSPLFPQVFRRTRAARRLVAHGEVTARPAWRRFLGLVAVFGVSYGQFPLYHLNQNQYFFRGVAQAGMGFLKNDWLFRTTDPWPVFTALVMLTDRYLGAGAFFLYFLLLLGAYGYGMTGIASTIFRIDRTRASYLAYLTCLTALHAPVVGALLARVIGFDPARQVVTGVALQELVGPMLQPATFGVLLLLSIHWFLRRSPLPATVAAAAAAIMHPTYLLPATLLIGTYLILLRARGEAWRTVLTPGALAAVLLVPMAAYLATAFRPASAETWATAQAVLVHFRMPHHAVISNWLGTIVYVKIGIVLVALVLIRRTQLFWIMTALLVSGVILTAIQARFNSDTLALLFPWRLSVLLVPLATCLIAAAVVSWMDELWRRPAIQRAVEAACAGVLVLLLGAGVLETRARFATRGHDSTRAVVDFVRTTGSPGLTYMIPQHWEGFRLATGAPAFVEWDFIPYRDVEVLEWFARFQLADRFYRGAADARCALADEITSRFAVTHIIVAERNRHACAGWPLVFTDPQYRVYAHPAAIGEGAGGR